MQKITSLQKKLETNPSLKGIRFVVGDDFRWDHTSKTVFYSKNSSDATAYLLHEAGHALLGHTDYSDDVSLIKMERSAWDKSIVLAEQYNMTISEPIIEDALDSYRDWLHARSTCPECSSTGIQSSKDHYACLACHTKWRVNESRVCALRRYKL